MKNDLRHLMYLQKAASSWNLFKKNPVLFSVAVNDYRYYKTKFQMKFGKSHVIEDGTGAQTEWKKIKSPYLGKIKYGYKSRNQEDYYNIPWSNTL